MNREVITTIVRAVADSTRKYIDGRFDAFSKRIDAMESRELPAGPKGDKGEPGPAGAAAVVDIPYIISELKAQIPTPKDGAPGRDGKDGESVHRDTVALMVREAVAEIPLPKDGAPGPAGKDAPPVDAEGIIAEVVKRVPVPQNGKDGAPGRDGKDADPINPQSIIDDVLKRIPAPKDGKDAPPVDTSFIIAEVIKQIPVPQNGKDGTDGQSVHPDTVALLVIQAVEKAVAALPKAIDGKDGKDGADAFAIEVLPCIDEARSYIKGTFAQHKGGLWRYSGAQWEVVVCGVADTIIEASADFRTFTIKTILSDGRTNEKTMTNPSMIYRGIFKAGEPYQPGDCVTKDGSIFLCKSVSSDAPGTSESWQLIVKRGADGKSGRDGKPGEPGPQGPAGRDLRYQ